MTQLPPQPFHPVLSAWFRRAFGEPTDVQLRAWDAIRDGAHTLIAAPTGSGKTLAALLPGLDRIARAKSDLGRPYAPGVRLLYVTPLKALNNDIHHHVVGFAAELDAIAAETGASDWRPLTAGVRTGDTSQSTRASMLKRPPDVLVTTPESLYLLLLADKSRDILRTVETVVVDEIHDLVPSKRGAHLSLTLERLTAMLAGAGRSAPQRIGVSATQKPLETAALFLGGVDAATGEPRPTAIVESAMDKAYDVRVTVPDYAAAAGGREAVWHALLERLRQLMGDAKTALIFVNNRRLSERLVLRLNERFGEGFARPHHGSVSRERRLEAERLLKEGALRCLVATSSLELGIDVGHIELVLQIDPPLSAAAGIQRIGRAGHGVGDTSVGRIVVRSRGALPQAAVLARLVRERDIEPIAMPPGPLDVLAQQTVAAVAAGPTDAGALLRLVRAAAPYRALTDDAFERLLAMLSGYYPFAKATLDWRRETGALTPRSNTRMAAMTGAGTIPSSANYPVYHADSKLQLGDLEEEFVHESRVGDVFQLGAHAWMIRDIKHDRVVVAEASNRYSEVPFWRGDAGGRSFALGERIGAFLRELEGRLGRQSDAELTDWLAAYAGFDARAAAELVDLARRQLDASALPTDRRVVVERYEDMTGQTHVVVHNFWGRRVNRAWLMALEHVWDESLPAPPYANAKDDGIELVFRAWQAEALPRLWMLTPETAERALQRAVPSSALFAGVFRRMAETALLLARGFSRVPSWLKRIRAEELLQASLPFADDFPLFGAALEECLREHLDVANLMLALARLRDGAVEVVASEGDAPSPLAAQFTLDHVSHMQYEGDAPSEELRRRLQSVSRELADRHFGADGESGGAGASLVVEPALLEAETKRLASGGRDVAGPDDVAALLKRRGDLSAEQLTKIAGADALDWAAAGLAAGRVAVAAVGGELRYIARDEADVYVRFPGDPTAAAFVLLRYIEGVIAFTAAELAERFGLPPEDAAARVEAWAAEGRIERPPFAEPGSPYWSSRQVASRLVRLSLASVRHAAAPVEPARWQRLLLARHGLDRPPASAGAEALRAALTPLQGLFLPASQWEQSILPARLPGYRKEELDLLCASGELTWLGRRRDGEKEGRIAFFLAGSEALLEGALAFGGAAAGEDAAGRRGHRAEADAGSAHPELLAALRARGASFLTRLSADTGEPPSALLPKLVELAWEGRVSNDQFAPMRNFLLAKGKLHPRLGSGHGRWYVVEPPAREPRLDQERALAWAKQLLRAFGGVTGAVVNAYAPFGWDAALPLLKQLEEWGLVARGFFVDGVPALQFMERETISSLRGWEAPDPQPQQPSQQSSQAPPACLLVGAADPAVPYGVALPWPDIPGAAFARKAGNYLVFVNGEWRYWIESNGKHIVRLGDGRSADAAALSTALKQLLRRGGLKRIRVETWNGVSAADAADAVPLLERGAERDRGALLLWPSALG
ncbi:DEAD/DEAH box helicase [Paenibacillus sp.]|uniref:DEAD/DEAH box helicase n=1 Tax=Paenibacillus sp. TaxID=58172 RepID=UPI002D41EAFB|nr:DEAD/DEAH box helicase [Paenibacillus sp.]HZG56018.1 DEAD/DEAH box helicase [Paenibacillus sp.]